MTNDLRHLAARPLLERGRDLDHVSLGFARTFHLDQLVPLERDLDGREHAFGRALVTDLNHGLQLVRERAQKVLLLARQRGQGCARFAFFRHSAG